MYTVQKNDTVIRTLVQGYDPKTGTYLRVPDGKDVVFRNEEELLRSLALSTDTNNSANPARWRNSYIEDQAYAGKHSSVSVVTIISGNDRFVHRFVGQQKNRYYWFHDASGKTIDVRKYWPAAVAAAITKEAAKTKKNGRTSWYWQGRRRHNTSGWHTRHPSGKARVKACLRSFSRQDFYDDEDNLIFRWTPRGRLLTSARYLADWDNFDFRARRSTGWKEHKYRHQWEHRVREQEKHQKNRARKAKYRQKANI